MKRLRWTKAARDDLYDILDYRGDLGSADIMIERIEDAPRALLDHPCLGELVNADLDIRKWKVQRTPFVLLYRVRPDGIQIVRVVHAPTDWRAA